MSIWAHIALIAETLMTIVCICRIYGQKIRADKKTAAVFFCILLILEIINRNHLDGKYSFLVYLVLFLYCTAEFKSAVSETLISMILWMVIGTAIQFLCILLANLLLVDAEDIRNAVSNTISLAAIGLLPPADGLHRLQKSICENSKFKTIMSGFICLILAVMFLQAKSRHEIQLRYFILTIPVVILLLFAVVKWDDARHEVEGIKERIHEIEGNKKNYENLLIKVRLRQHALKNHMEAISAFQYTQKTVGKSGQAGEEYFNRLRKENKYNDLLLTGDEILTGFLYGKFQEAENNGIEINYRITAAVGQCRVPIYYVIEMLGILFDNAIEALKNADEKEIFFEVCETDEKYEFLLGNPFRYVSYDEIEEWFRYEKSGKGSGRGLGLYHLKCLCTEWNCDIGCRNREIRKANWIVFSLGIDKCGSQKNHMK
ncbi:MAG: GHKL domain-containing protein [Eubacterium sp.]|nr:GHKL domain-containing protein [Eubacterium sp.]